MRVIITGGGGFLGKAMLKALLKKDIEVISLSRASYPELEELGAQHFQVDISDLNALEHTIRSKVKVDRNNKIDALFRVASLVKPYGPAADFDQINILGTRNIITLCHIFNIPKLIFTSTPSVIHDGKDSCNINESKAYPQKYLCHYFRSKAEAEKLVIHANSKELMTCSLRPHGIFGPGDTSLFPLLIKKANTGRLKIIGKGNTKIDWTYIDNAVSAHILALEKLIHYESAPAGKSYFISNGEPVNPWDFFNELLKKLNKPTINKHVPMSIALFTARQLERIWRLKDSITSGEKTISEPPITEAMVSVLGTSHYFDLSAAKKDLGYTAIVSLQEGVEKTIPWLRQF